MGYIGVITQLLTFYYLPGTSKYETLVSPGGPLGGVGWLVHGKDVKMPAKCTNDVESRMQSTWNYPYTYTGPQPYLSSILGIQSPCQRMIEVFDHLLSKVFGFRYHSEKVNGIPRERSWIKSSTKNNGHTGSSKIKSQTHTGPLLERKKWEISMAPCFLLFLWGLSQLVSD